MNNNHQQAASPASGPLDPITNRPLDSTSFQRLHEISLSAQREGQTLSPNFNHALRVAWILRDPGPYVPVEDDPIEYS
jgi:hypothetical protein